MAKQRHLSSIFLLTCLIFSIVACSNQGVETPVLTVDSFVSTPRVTPTNTPTPTPDFAEGTISIWHSLDEQEIQTLVQVIADFQNLYPDSKFDVLYLPESILLDRYIQAAQEGTGPDMLLGPSNWAPELVELDLVKDLNEMVKPELRARLNSAGLEAGKVGDIQAGLPYSIDGVVLFRNRSLVASASENWDELISKAQEVTAEDRVGAFLDRGFYYSGGHLFALGGKLWGPDESPAFNTEAGIEWIRLVDSFSLAGPTDFLTSQDVERFTQGKAGYIIDLASNREALADQIGSQNLAIDPWPTFGDQKLSGFLSPQLFFINPNIHADSILLAALFGNYLLSPEAQARLATIGLIPSVLDAPVEDPLTREAVQALVNNVPYPSSPRMDLYRTALDQALQAIFSGANTPEEALANAEAILLESLHNIQPTSTP
jgi:maltose-binding protein MalE